MQSYGTPRATLFQIAAYQTCHCCCNWVFLSYECNSFAGPYSRKNEGSTLGRQIIPSHKLSIVTHDCSSDKGVPYCPSPPSVMSHSQPVTVKSCTIIIKDVMHCELHSWKNKRCLFLNFSLWCCCVNIIVIAFV